MLTLVLGGASSGKSAVAENICMDIPGRKAYIATMMPFGEQAQLRITRHLKLRESKGMDTVECYTDISTIAHVAAEYDVLLIEDMTNLVANEIFSPAAAPSAESGTWLNNGSNTGLYGKSSAATNALTDGELSAKLSIASCITQNSTPNSISNTAPSGEPNAITSSVLNGNISEKILNEISQLSRICPNLVIVTCDVFCGGASYENETLEYMRHLGRLNQMLADRADRVIEVWYGLVTDMKGGANEAY